MATPLVKSVTAEVVEPSIAGCQFAYDDGRMCLDSKVQARNLCARHYQQLRRLGAFERQRTARTDEALANINADRLAKARDILERAAPHLARQLVKASKVAATKGHHKAALDTLLHARAIEPIAKDSASNSHGLTINVGVKLAGISSTQD